MSSKLVLYDLPRKGRCACWSPNVWRTRLVLNYKKVPYTTTWVEHPDIAPTFQKLGIQPNTTQPGSAYTVPTIQFTDGAAVMDSMAIAKELEKLYPDPSLHLDKNEELIPKFQQIYGRIGFPLAPVFMPRLGRDIICDSSREWFYSAREKMFGMPLDELEKVKGGEKAWEGAQPGLEDLRKFVKENKKDDGPFVLGSELSYVDLLIVAFLASFKRIGDDLYEKIVGGDKALEGLYQACEKWMVDDQ